MAADVIKESIERYLNNAEMRYSYSDVGDYYHFGIVRKGPVKNIEFNIPVLDEAYKVDAKITIGPDPDNKDMMHSIMELICIANYCLERGDFKLDTNDGEISYRTFVDCKGIVPSEGVVENSIMYPYYMFEYLIPGIIAVIFRGASADDAIQLCESINARKQAAQDEAGSESGDEDGDVENGIENDGYDDGYDDIQGEPEDGSEEVEDGDSSSIPTFDEYLRKLKSGS